MNFFLSLLLGLVQGIAEFLPISSSGHLSILQNFILKGGEDSSHLFFDALLHLGTLASICVVYQRDLRLMFNDTVNFIQRRDEDENSARRYTPSIKMVLFVVIATLPLIIAIPFYSKIESLFYNTGFIGFMLLITGTIIFFTDKLTADGNKTIKNMSIADAVIVGLSQVIAIIPGLSRSGVTISVGMTLGMKRDFAIRFSLIMSIPAVFGSFLLTLIKSFKAGISFGSLPVYLVGLIVAAVVGFFAVNFLRKLTSQGKYGNFAYYCWAVGLITLFLTVLL